MGLPNKSSARPGNLCWQRRGRSCEQDLMNRRCSIRLDSVSNRCVSSHRINSPASSAIKRDSPMPTGAMNVPLCFSAASMKIVNTSCAVRNISMNSPCALLVPPLRDVVTARGPGNKALTIPADAIAPSICAMKTRAPRIKGTAPMRQRPRVTWIISVTNVLLMFLCVHSQLG